MVLNTALLTVTFNADKLAISGTGTSSHATVTGTKESAQKNRHKRIGTWRRRATKWRPGDGVAAGKDGARLDAEPPQSSPVLPSPPQNPAHTASEASPGLGRIPVKASESPANGNGFVRWNKMADGRCGWVEGCWGGGGGGGGRGAGNRIAVHWS